MSSGTKSEEEKSDSLSQNFDVDDAKYKAHDFAHPNPEVSWLLGVLAVFVSCLSSGFSGVYFERLVKHGKQTSLVIRNIQLGNI